MTVKYDKHLNHLTTCRKLYGRRWRSFSVLLIQRRRFSPKRSLALRPLPMLCNEQR